MTLKGKINPLTGAGTSMAGRGDHHLDHSDLRAAELLTEVYGRLTQELGRVIVGQTEVLKQVLIALFCQGHCILEGVPGVAKTLMISSIAKLLVASPGGRIAVAFSMPPSRSAVRKASRCRRATFSSVTMKARLDLPSAAISRPALASTSFPTTMS